MDWEIWLTHLYCSGYSAVPLSSAFDQVLHAYISTSVLIVLQETPALEKPVLFAISAKALSLMKHLQPLALLSNQQ